MASARLRAVRTAVAAQADSTRAAGVARFFKTGPGEYGEGDDFRGVTTPVLRRIARDARDLDLNDCLELLRSKWHEERALALLLLVDAHTRGSRAEKEAIRRAYLDNTRYVNNWDLVDASAGQIVGEHVTERGTTLVERLAKSPSLWERRIAMIATFHSIRRGDVRPALLIAQRLLDDEEDLIHKAAGWMLREAEKRDSVAVRRFLERHAATMPRTALRYAIERFDAAERRRLMALGSARRVRASSTSASSRANASFHGR